MSGWSNYHGDGTTIPLRYRLQAIQHFLSRIAEQETQAAADRKYMDDDEARIAELEAEVERLKVCGNCGNHDDAAYSRCAVDHRAVPYSVACKFDPSRWTERGTS